MSKNLNLMRKRSKSMKELKLALDHSKLFEVVFQFKIEFMNNNFEDTSSMALSSSGHKVDFLNDTARHMVDIEDDFSVLNQVLSNTEEEEDGPNHKRSVTSGDSSQTQNIESRLVRLLGVLHEIDQQTKGMLEGSRYS